MFPVTFENFMTKQLRDWKVMDRYWQRAYEAVEFQYTYWPDPKNRTARAQEFINVNLNLNPLLGVDHWTTRGGYVFLGFFLKFVQQIVQKKSLFSPENKLKVQQTDGLFHAQGGGGGKISCSDPQGKTIYCLVSEMKKK